MANKRYTVVVTDKVRKTILKLPQQVASKIETSLLELEEDSRPAGCKKLKGRTGYRIRVGDYRIVYSIYDNERIVDIVRIRHRSEAYR
jgi:mRNA interferase RelE/StbE